MAKILHELTKEGAKCLGIDLMEIVENGNTTTTDEIQPANSYKIQLDLDNLDKLKDCGIKCKFWIFNNNIFYNVLSNKQDNDSQKIHTILNLYHSTGNVMTDELANEPIKLESDFWS